MYTIEEFNNMLIDSHKKMSPHMKKAIEYILKNPNQVAIQSMRTIAKRAAVHPSTLVRLAQKLSFEGYQDLRALYQNQFKHDQYTNTSLAEDLLNDKQLHTNKVIDNTRKIVLTNLDEYYKKIDPVVLEATAKLIWNCTHIYITGLRNDSSIASLFYYNTLQFTPDVSLIEAPSSLRSGTLRYIKPGEVMIVFACKPYTKAIVEMIDYAIAKGADIIAITDSKVSPLALKAKISFILPEVEQSGYNHLFPVVALTNLIMATVIREGGEKSLQRLKYSDEKMGEFL